MPSLIDMKASSVLLLSFPLLVLGSYPPLFGPAAPDFEYPVAKNINEFKEDCSDRYVKAANNLTRAVKQLLNDPYSSGPYGDFFIAGSAATFVEPSLINVNWMYHRAFDRSEARRVVNWSADVVTAATRMLNAFPSLTRGKSKMEMRKIQNAVGKELQGTYEVYRSAIELYFVNRTESVVTGREYTKKSRFRPTYLQTQHPVLSLRLQRQGNRLKNLAEKILREYKRGLVYDADVFVEGLEKVYNKYPAVINVLDGMKNCTDDARKQCPILLQQLQDMAPLYLPIKKTLPGPEFPFGGGSEGDVLVAAFEKHSGYTYKRFHKRLSEKLKYCDVGLADDFAQILKAMGENFNDLMLPFSTCFPDTEENRKRGLVQNIKTLGQTIKSNYESVPLPGSEPNLPSQCT